MKRLEKETQVTAQQIITQSVSTISEDGKTKLVTYHYVF